MKCLLNPVSGEVKRVPDSEARYLASYGWVYIPKAKYRDLMGQRTKLVLKAMKEDRP